VIVEGLHVISRLEISTCNMTRPRLAVADALWIQPMTKGAAWQSVVAATTLSATVASQLQSSFVCVTSQFW
jgi:hypothetical protein